MTNNPLNQNKPKATEAHPENQNQPTEPGEVKVGQESSELEIHQQAIEELREELARREKSLQEMQTAKETETPKKSASTSAQTQNPPKTVSNQAPITEPDQVNQLMNVALTKGLNEAISQAKKTNDPYLIDELHDVLVRELYQRLVDQKK